MVFKKYDKGGCVGCPPGIGCLGNSCPQCWDTIMECDCCGDHVDELHIFEREQLCNECFMRTLTDMYPHITNNNAERYVVRVER